MFASMPCNRVHALPWRALTVVEGSPLFGSLSHRYPAGDLQSIGMIGDGRNLIATLQAGVGNLPYRRMAVTPFGVHLQVATVLLKTGTRPYNVVGIPPLSAVVTSTQYPQQRPSPREEHRCAGRSSRVAEIEPGPFTEHEVASVDRGD
jgi:hypothetical protein